MLMKPFAVYSVLKYLQRAVKFFFEKCLTYVFSTWGAYDQIFSQFLKITFNNVVNKFAIEIRNLFCEKCMREKLLV